MRVRTLAHLALVLAVTGVAYAETGEEEALNNVYGGADFVSIATGYRQHLSEAPATATVITAAQIEALGATDLDQVLESVPGLHVARSQFFFDPVYVIRGIHSFPNPQVLMLVNGIPITNLFAGDRGLIWGGMPVQSIARIEVVRGPGSALYGADAYAGTINIITKGGADVSGTQWGARAGSFDTYDTWLLHGATWGAWRAAFTLELHDTNGSDEIIEADTQTALDRRFGTQASLAPGPLNTHAQSADMRLDVARDAWRLRLGYQGRRDIGTGSGINQALDPRGAGDSDRWSADLTYHDPDFSKNWDVTAQLSYLDVDLDYRLTLNPPGANLGAGIFPDGAISNIGLDERHQRAELIGLYRGIENHRLRLGMGLRRGDLYKSTRTNNFTAALAPRPEGVIDVTDIFPLIRPAQRNVYYALAQDEWTFAPDWSFTAGARFDHYSDFGATVNPRLALIWQTRFDFTTKLLYGHAFRAPSFAEFYNVNNTVALGNPNLKPETIDTVELVFDYHPLNDLHSSVSVFRYTMDDIVRFMPDPGTTSFTAQNSGRQTGYGFEWEWEWQASRALRLHGNYAAQYSTDKMHDAAAGNGPGHHVFVGVEWGVAPHWRWNTQVNWVADRKRAPGDTRPEIKDYTTVDMTLRYKEKQQPWHAALAVRNVFDADAREPSPAPGHVPNDFPLPGRSVFIEVERRF